MRNKNCCWRFNVSYLEEFIFFFYKVKFILFFKVIGGMFFLVNKIFILMELKKYNDLFCFCFILFLKFCIFVNNFYVFIGVYFIIMDFLFYVVFSFLNCIDILMGFILVIRLRNSKSRI